MLDVFSDMGAMNPYHWSMHVCNGPNTGPMCQNTRCIEYFQHVLDVSGPTRSVGRTCDLPCSRGRRARSFSVLFWACHPRRVSTWGGRRVPHAPDGTSFIQYSLLSFGGVPRLIYDWPYLDTYPERNKSEFFCRDRQTTILHRTQRLGVTRTVATLGLNETQTRFQ